jgi:hypothetical protein
MIVAQCAMHGSLSSRTRASDGIIHTLIDPLRATVTSRGIVPAINCSETTGDEWQSSTSAASQARAAGSKNSTLPSSDPAARYSTRLTGVDQPWSENKLEPFLSQKCVSWRAKLFFCRGKKHKKKSNLGTDASGPRASIRWDRGPLPDPRDGNWAHTVTMHSTRCGPVSRHDRSREMWPRVADFGKQVKEEKKSERNNQNKPIKGNKRTPAYAC